MTETAAKPKRTPRGNEGKGRPKGSKNKTCVSRDVRQMALNALNRKGGEEYLMRQAEENPKAFMAMLTRLIPNKIEGDADNPLRMIHKIERVFIDSAEEGNGDD